VCPFVLSIEDEDEHARHFFARSAGGDRRSSGYLEHIGDIRRLQTFIVERAEHEGVPVIENVDAERTAVEMMELVRSAADRVRL
jgi:2-phosphoglycerate kinase